MSLYIHLALDIHQIEKSINIIEPIQGYDKVG